MIEIFILSTIQGITEFLPVSSSAHLILVSKYFDFHNQSLSIDVSLHIGSFLAVVVYFKKDVFSFFKNKKLFYKIFISSLPIMIVGYILIKFNLIYYLRNIKIIGWTTIIFGIILYYSDKFNNKKIIKSDFNFKSALIIGLFVLRSLKISELPDVIIRAGLTSSVVLLLVGAAMAFKTVVSLSHAPEQLAEFILTLTDNPLLLLFLINILLFVVGMFLDAGPAIIILGPILGPIFIDLGVDPIHFAIIMSVNLTVGLATPPMGLVLFVASAVSGERVEAIAKAILPFLAVEIVVIFLITYIPALSMTIPRLTGFVQ